jgi:hypothetical protein
MYAIQRYKPAKDLQRLVLNIQGVGNICNLVSNFAQIRK